MTLKELYAYCVVKAKQHPNHSESILSFYNLTEMEIEDGGSVNHECELALNDINELIKNC